MLLLSFATQVGPGSHGDVRLNVRGQSPEKIEDICRLYNDFAGQHGKFGHL
jgi:hypothetical protein